MLRIILAHVILSVRSRRLFLMRSSRLSWLKFLVWRIEVNALCLVFGCCQKHWSAGLNRLPLRAAGPSGLAGLASSKDKTRSFRRLAHGQGRRVAGMKIPFYRNDQHGAVIGFSHQKPTTSVVGGFTDDQSFSEKMSQCTICISPRSVFDPMHASISLSTKPYKRVCWFCSGVPRRSWHAQSKNLRRIRRK